MARGGRETTEAKQQTDAIVRDTRIDVEVDGGDDTVSRGASAALPAQTPVTENTTKDTTKVVKPLPKVVEGTPTPLGQKPRSLDPKSPQQLKAKPKVKQPIPWFRQCGRYSAAAGGPETQGSKRPFYQKSCGL